MHVTSEEAAVLTAIGEYNGRLYRHELTARIEQGHLDRRQQVAYRTERKRVITADTSSRWAGTITRAVEDQYQLGMRALTARARSLDSAIQTLAARCALAPGERDRRITGYRDDAERFQKTRRLTALRDKAERAHQRLEAGCPSIVMGGKRLWRSRNHLDTADLTEHQWQQEWDAARLFLAADGETGKIGGNETIRVSPETQQLRIKVPAGLTDRFGTHLTIAAPVEFNYRFDEWSDRIQGNRAVRYDISYDPRKQRWYLAASWAVEPAQSVPLATIRTGRVLGVDLNDGHLATCVLDTSGNPIGAPGTIDVAIRGLSASQRDGHLRAAITTLLDIAEHFGCAAIVIENLDFAEARETGRETLGRGKRGKRFRRAVTGIPTSRFRERLRGMAARRDLAVVAVDPAYTSKVGGKCWRAPLQKQTKTPGRMVTVHHGAAVAIGRRGLGFKLSRHSTGPRHAQRSVTGQLSSLVAVSTPVRMECGKLCPTPGPHGRPAGCGSKHTRQRSRPFGPQLNAEERSDRESARPVRWIAGRLWGTRTHPTID
ncbi:hypothetical protein [Nocardia sp. NPDC127526]|uniref:hypothetical protein n=1 Tax=Nocardia sp. NPDC127526 TaxID=3345393 RepID=UPI00362D460F